MLFLMVCSFLFQVLSNQLCLADNTLYLMPEAMIKNNNKSNQTYSCKSGERGGSVVECRTPEREVRGSRPTAAVLCP